MNERQKIEDFLINGEDSEYYYDAYELAYQFGRYYRQRCDIRDDISRIDEFYDLNTFCYRLRLRLIRFGVYDRFWDYVVSNQGLPTIMDYEYLVMFDLGYEGANPSDHNPDIDFDYILESSKNTPVEPLPQWKKNHIFKRFGCICSNCGHKDYKTHDFEIDHIIPVSRGGTNAIGNLQVLCKTCNRDKSNKLPSEWTGGSMQ